MQAVYFEVIPGSADRALGQSDRKGKEVTMQATPAYSSMTIPEHYGIRPSYCSHREGAGCSIIHNLPFRSWSQATSGGIYSGTAFCHAWQNVLPTIEGCAHRFLNIGYPCSLCDGLLVSTPGPPQPHLFSLFQKKHLSWACGYLSREDFFNFPSQGSVAK